MSAAVPGRAGGIPAERASGAGAPRHGRAATRILVLAPFPPRLDGVHGGSRAVAHLALALAAGNRVALAYLRAEDEPPVSAALAAACERVVEGRRGGYSHSSVRPWPRAFAALPRLAAGRPLWVAARWNAAFAARVAALVSGWRPDIAQAEFSAMAQYLAPGRQHGAPCVVTIHEPGVIAAGERIGRRERGTWFWRLDRALWTRYERAVVRGADATVVFTERDRDALQRLVPAASLERIPLGVTLPERAADPLGAEPPSLLFFGNFSHPPNLDAVEWLLAGIFPALRRRFPALRLTVVGASAPAALQERQVAGVTITGEVPSLAPYLDAASVVLAPLRHGGGMRVKVLESLAAGKAVVATRLAVEGLDLEPGRHALVADDTEAFIEAVASLLEDDARRAALAGAGRAWVAAGFAWRRTAAAYEALYDRLLGPAAAARGADS